MRRRRSTSIALVAGLSLAAAALTPLGGASAQPGSAPPGGGGRAVAYDRTISLVDRDIRVARVDAGELARARAADRPRHAVVQLHELPSPGDLDRLRELGITPLAYLNGRSGTGTAYLAALGKDVADGEQLGALVRGVHALLPKDKLDPDLARGGVERAVLVTFFADVTDDEARAALARVGATGTPSGTSTYRADLTTAEVMRLATDDVVQFVAHAPLPGQLDLDVSRTLSSVDALQQFDVPSATYLGLSGLGVQVGIHDSGVDEHHRDFAGRMVRTMHPGAGGDHGTHVASIAAGSGVMSDQDDDAGMSNGTTPFRFRGMAPQAQIAAFGSQTAHDIGTMTTAVVTDGVDVSNHSYSYSDGQYDATMASIDSIIRGDAGIPARPVVFSAGNQGGAPQYGQNSGYFSLSKSCKNCIMVANLQSTGALNGGSSQGPTPDGRVKPEIGALGTSVMAAGADVDNGDGGSSTGNSYRGKGGTSMATPAVTGIVALMLQRYAQVKGVDLDSAPPLPSTTKALLVQAARDQAGTGSGTNPDTGSGTVYGPGPDWATGYGVADAGAAVRLIDTDRFLEDSVDETDHTDEHVVSVAPGQTELRVTLAWDDLAGTPNSNHAASALVNDLDLLLVGPQGQVVRPLVLPGATQFDCDADSTNGTQTGSCSPGSDPGPWPSSGTAIDAAQGTDRLNNLEQVVVAAPAPGVWKARVSVLNTDTTRRLPLGGTQSYSLAGVTDDRADLRISKTDSPDPATAGGRLLYGISVANDGPDTARGATVVDTLPAGVSYVTSSAPGGCVEAPARTLTCGLGDLASGDSRSFTVEVAVSPRLVSDNGGPTSVVNTAAVSSTTPDEDPRDNTATIGTLVGDSADLSVSKICKPDRHLLAGQTGTCTIYVDNPGPSYAREVVLRDSNLSDGAFTIQSVTPSQGTCSPPSGGVVTCQLGTLAASSASQPGRATVTVEVSANEEVDINDVADVRATTPDPDTSNNEAHGTINVQAVSDLALSMTGPPTAVAGTDAVYSLTAVNSGPSTARGVVVQDVAPTGVQILSVTGSDGATCSAGTPGSAALPSTCSFGDLAPGATRSMTVSVRVLPDTLGPLHHDAAVRSATFDDDLSDNLATVRTDVRGVADLALAKVGSPNPVLAGEQLTYTMGITNTGPSTARSVSVSDELPTGTTFVSGVDGTGATVCATVQPDRVVCDLGNMAPGARKTVYLTALVAPSVASGTVLSNAATVSSATDDGNSSNDSAVALTDVRTQADLWLDKLASQRSGNPSPVVVYELVVHNDSGCEADAQSSPTPTCGDGGPSHARDVVVTDRLPLDPKKLVVQYVSPQCTYDRATHTVRCTTAEVPAGSAVRFVIEAQVGGSVGTITNTASVVSATPDPATSNGTNSASLVMKGGTGKK